MKNNEINNPLVPIFNSFLFRLNTFKGLSLALDQLLKNVAPPYWVSPDGSIGGHWSSESWLDIYDIETQKMYFRKVFIIQSGKTQKSELELNALFSRFSVCQAYESFESFLKDSLTTFLYFNPSAVEVKEWARFEKSNIAHTFNEKNISYYRAFVNHSYKGNNNKELFKLMRRLDPSFSEKEKHGRFMTNLTKWFEEVSVYRHKATHQSMCVEFDDIKFSDKECKTGERWGFHWVASNVHHFVDYAFIIFKSLSTLGKWEIEDEL